MKNQSVLPRWSTLLCLTAFAAFLYCSYGAIAAEGPPEKTTQRADIVLMETMAAKDAEFPPAVFPHDTHDKALQAMGKDCSACHTEKVDGKLTFTFKEGSGVAEKDLKDFYHNNCVSCHTDLLSQGVKTGPIQAECRTCHTAYPPSNEGWSEIPYSKVLHSRHLTATAGIPLDPATNTNCGACHASYDENMKRVDYIPGTEESCRSCHYNDAEFSAAAKKQAELEAAAQKAGQSAPAIDDFKLATGLTLGDISHRSCVNCHMEVNSSLPADSPERTSETISAPTSCEGCHGQAMVSMLKEVNNYKHAVQSRPRLMRGQPDSVVMLPKSEKGIVSDGGMALVTFDHKLHEQVTLDCRTCHHKEISACSSCHTLEGTASTDYANIAHVMHKEDSNRSCVGCHNEIKKQSECAGCHVVMPRDNMPESSCGVCHNTVTRSYGKTEPLTAKRAQGMSEKELEAIAIYMTKERQDSSAGLVSLADIPETVTIDYMVNENEAVVMPHRDIVKALADKVENNQMVKAFHTVDTALCMGCHHESPASITPPKCVSCHSIESGLATVNTKVDLEAAYHQQCIGCHVALDQKPLANDCVDCHQPVKR